MKQLTSTEIKTNLRTQVLLSAMILFASVVFGVLGFSTFKNIKQLIDSSQKLSKGTNSDNQNRVTKATQPTSFDNFLSILQKSEKFDVAQLKNIIPVFSEPNAEELQALAANEPSEIIEGQIKERITTDKRFKIFYTTDANSPDKVRSEKFVDAVAQALEEVWQEVIIDRDWKSPVKAIHEDGYLYVYLMNIEENYGGYATENFIAINVNHLYTLTTHGIKAVTKHEFIHLSQSEYLTGEWESWLGESTATWLSYQLEDFYKTEPLIINFMTFFRWYFDNISLFSIAELEGTENWPASIRYTPLWWQYLYERYGDDDLPRRIYEKISQGQTTLTAIDDVIREQAQAQQKESSLLEEFREYSSWNYQKHPYSFADVLYDSVKVEIQNEFRDFSAGIKYVENSNVPQALATNYVEFYPDGSEIGGLIFKGDENVLWGVTVLGYSKLLQALQKVDQNKTPTISNRSAPLYPNIMEPKILFNNKISQANAIIPIVDWNDYEKIVLIIQNLSTENNASYYEYSTSSLNDVDGDGLSNWEEETVYSTNPYNYDSDDDGLNDGDEAKNYNTDPLNADSDNDSLPDGWEIQYNLNPNAANDADMDTDDDGLSNKKEYELGLNPASSDTITLLSEGNYILSNNLAINDQYVAWVESTYYNLYAYNISTRQKVEIPKMEGVSKIQEPWLSKNRLLFIQTRDNKDEIVLFNFDTNQQEVFLREDDAVGIDGLYQAQIFDHYIVVRGVKIGTSSSGLYLFDVNDSNRNAILLSTSGVKVNYFYMNDGYITWTEGSDNTTWLHKMNDNIGDKLHLSIGAQTAIIGDGKLAYIESGELKIFDLDIGDFTKYLPDRNLSDLSFDGRQVVAIDSEKERLYVVDIDSDSSKEITYTDGKFLRDVKNEGIFITWIEMDMQNYDFQIYLRFIDQI